MNIPIKKNGITIGPSDKGKYHGNIDHFSKPGVLGLKSDKAGFAGITPDKKKIWTFDGPTLTDGVAKKHDLNMINKGPLEFALPPAGEFYVVQMTFDTFIVEKQGNSFVILGACT